VSRYVLAVQGGLLACVLAGCGDGPRDSGSPASDAPSSRPPVAATANPSAPASDAAAELLQFSAPLVGGGTLDAATLAGTPTVFWFWAPT
jgi:hypothetical protein